MKNFDVWFRADYLPVESGYRRLMSEFMRNDENRTPQDGRKVMNRLIDYHYAYVAMKAYIEELEGKVYALEQTIDGRTPEVA